MNACKNCKREGRFYRVEPSDYVAWSDWADEMVKTHHQEQCPGCGNFTVWRKGPPERLAYEFSEANGE